MRYILLTSAHNEQGTIADTLRSVLNQTLRPAQWIIVNDASTDATPEILHIFSRVFKFITVVHRKREAGRSFGAKASALELARAYITEPYDYIGNLDADITLPGDYYEKLIEKMGGQIGIASGAIWEDGKPREGNRVYSVPHGAQLVSKDCFEAIGGWRALPFGGEDTHAVTGARMMGYRIQCFSSLPVAHAHRTQSTFRRAYREGRMDYHLGYHPLFELTKSTSLAGLVRFAGYIRSIGDKRAVSPKYVRFVQRGQRALLKASLRAGQNVSGYLNQNSKP